MATQAQIEAAAEDAYHKACAEGITRRRPSWKLQPEVVKSAWRKTVEAALAAAEAAAWQPIETAKDRTGIIVFPLFNPTHWRPLPPPPSPLSNTAGEG